MTRLSRLSVLALFLSLLCACDDADRDAVGRELEDAGRRIEEAGRRGAEAARSAIEDWDLDLDELDDRFDGWRRRASDSLEGADEGARRAYREALDELEKLRRAARAALEEVRRDTDGERANGELRESEKKLRRATEKLERRLEELESR